MKKIVLWIVAAVLILGAAVTAFMIASVDKEEAVVLEPIDDPVFVYVNLEQIGAKGAFEKFITPENRALIATALSSQVEGAEQVEHIKSIAINLESLGIDIHTPIYGYLTEDLTNGVVVANVSDVTLLDRSVALLSYLVEQSGGKLEVVNEGDIRMFACEEFYVAYNTSTFAVALGDDAEDMTSVRDALNRPQMDMSIFGASDLAVLVNTGKCMELASAKVSEAMAELNDMYGTGEVDAEEFAMQSEALAASEEMILGYSSYFEPNSNIVLSATFDLGRMSLAYNSNGVNFGEYAAICKEVNMTHLNNLGKDSYAVMSMGVDGAVLAQLVRTLLNGEMLQSVGITPTNEVNMFVSIACDALSTINGGVTLALEELDGEIKQRYNYYWDEYSVEPSIKSVKAMLMADVADTYIISNVAQFAGGFLKRVDATHYTLRLMNYNFSMGQDDSLFHIGVNMSPGVQTPSAVEAEWAKDIEGAVSYVVVNIDALMSGRFMQSANKYISSQLLAEYRGVYSDAAEAVSYVYLKANSLESAEVVVVFDDKSVNALEQINGLVLPLLTRECVKSLF